MISTFANMFTMYFERRDVSALSFYHEVVQRFLPLPVDATSERYRFFYEVDLQLYICCELLDQTQRRLTELRWTRELPQAIDKCHKRLLELFAEVRVAPESNIEQAELASLLEQIRLQSHLRPSPFMDWLQLYQRFVFIFRMQTEMLQAERRQLEQRFADSVTQNDRMLLQMLSAHEVLRGEDERAYSLLARLKPEAQTAIDFADVRILLHDLHERQQWLRLKWWLQRTAAKAVPIGSLVPEYVTLWLALPSSKVSDSELEAVFERTMPHSGPQFAAYLLEKQQDERWLQLYIHMQHLKPLLLTDIPSELQARRPDLVIVIYHQLIDRAVIHHHLSHAEVIGLLQALKDKYTLLKKDQEWHHFSACFKLKFKKSRKLLSLLQEVAL